MGEKVNFAISSCSNAYDYSDCKITCDNSLSTFATENYSTDTWIKYEPSKYRVTLTDSVGNDNYLGYATNVNFNVDTVENNFANLAINKHIPNNKELKVDTYRKYKRNRININ